MDLDKDNRPTDTNPSGGELNPEEGSGEGSSSAGNDPSSDSSGKEVLNFLGETLGREFKDVDEAKKSLKNLNSRVGDSKYSAFSKVVEKVMSENNVSYDDAIELLSTAQFKAEKREEIKSKSEDRRIAALERELQENKLLKKYPEAEHFLTDISDLAKARGLSLVEAFEASEVLKNSAKLYADSQGKDTPFVESKKGSGGGGSSNFKSLAAQHKKQPTAETEAALVAEKLREMGQI